MANSLKDNIGQVKSVCNCGFGYACAELEGCQEDKD